jgi:hypothetical protein
MGITVQFHAEKHLHSVMFEIVCSKQPVFIESIACLSGVVCEQFQSFMNVTQVMSACVCNFVLCLATRLPLFFLC